MELIQRFRSHAGEAFVDHPELRSVLVIFDYVGTLNDSNIEKGVWLSVDGKPKTPAEIFGMLRNVLTILEQLFVEAVKLEDGMRDRVIALGIELEERSKQRGENKGAGTNG